MKIIAYTTSHSTNAILNVMTQNYSVWKIEKYFKASALAAWLLETGSWWEEKLKREEKLPRHF